MLIAHISVLFLMHFLCVFTVCCLPPESAIDFEKKSMMCILHCMLWFKFDRLLNGHFISVWIPNNFFPIFYCPLNCFTLEWKQGGNYLWISFRFMGSWAFWITLASSTRLNISIMMNIVYSTRTSWANRIVKYSVCELTIFRAKSMHFCWHCKMWRNLIYYQW